MSAAPPARDAATRRLDARLLEFIAAAPAGFDRCGTTRAARWGSGDATAVEAQFESLALELFAYQVERVEVYRAYVALARGGATPQTSAAVPPLPVEAFRHARVAGFPPAACRLSFHTSGTSAARAGVLELDDPSLYALSLERAFRHHVLPDRDSIRILVVAPPAAAAPHSSLSYMFEHVQRRFGAAGTECAWAAGQVHYRALHAGLDAACRDGEPLCLLGTAFTWVQVADACESEGFRVELPAGSRLLETGGYKGRSRTLSRTQLSAAVERCFGIPANHVVSEYGMTEMGSQLYTTALRAAVLGTPLDDVWSHPAWLRPRLVDSETGVVQELDAAREVGLLAHHDLANRGSVAHLLTADLARPRAGSFDLAGRCPRAERRGCGLASEVAGVA